MTLVHQQLAGLRDHLAGRRTEILQRWWEAAAADPVQTTANSLTRAQFNDHIPALLDAFELKLGARPGGAVAAAADESKSRADMKHGLQRWQQGYKLAELMHEWGHFHRCLGAEIHEFWAGNAAITRETVGAAHDELIALISEGVNESAVEYGRLQQAEAAGHVADLQRALADLTAIDTRRVALIHQSIHDLRGNMQAVGSMAEVLLEPKIADGERMEFAKVIQQGVGTVSTMLGELLYLARLEAGKDRRILADFDAARVLRELCGQTAVMAAEKDLFMHNDGPASLPVEGDADKVRRLVQNLLFNALKYTKIGGVTVTWGEEKEKWWVAVKDTGPGLMAGPTSPIVLGLNEATASAREAEEKEAAEHGGTPTVLPPAAGGPAASRKAEQPGEGIGLSIVKRLCELLDASLELASSAQTGTTFRVVFPRRYDGAAL